jgi:hypothetical protein
MVLATRGLGRKPLAGVHFQLSFCLSIVLRAAHNDHWRSGKIAFCFRWNWSRRRKSLSTRRLQIVEPRGKRSAIDKMNSFCRLAALEGPGFLDPMAMVDRQNRGAFCFILCAGAVRT